MNIVSSTEYDLVMTLTPVAQVHVNVLGQDGELDDNALQVTLAKFFKGDPGDPATSAVAQWADENW